MRNLNRRLAVAALCAGVALAGPALAAKPVDSLKKGTPDIKSAGPLAFAPDGILLIGDSLGAAVFAIDTGDRPVRPASGPLQIDNLGGKVAGLLGVDARQVTINDLAVNPLSGNAYLSVTRGQGPDALPVLLRVSRSGKIEDLPLKDIPHARAELPDAPGPDKKDRRGQPERVMSITDIEYTDGKVFVAGLSTEEFSSTLRVIPFPFEKVGKGTGVKIFHGAHGKFETHSPVRTFVPYEIKKEAHLLAAYTCTPLVKFPVSDLKPGAQVTGTTIAELGNRNRPLDIIVYQKGGKDYLLMANSARGVMKITTDGITSIEAITSPVKGGKTAGLSYETIKDLQGVTQLALLDAEHALILVEGEGTTQLKTIPLP